MPYFICPVDVCENHDGYNCKLKSVFMESIGSINTDELACCAFEYKKEVCTECGDETNQRENNLCIHCLFKNEH